MGTAVHSSSSHEATLFPLDQTGKQPHDTAPSQSTFTACLSKAAAAMMRLFVLCVVIQVAAAAAALAVYQVGTRDAWLAAACYLVVSSFIFSYWLKLLSDIRVKDVTAEVREKFLAERERIKVQAEQEKLSMVRDTHKQVSREAARASARANTKIALIAAAAVFGGIALIATQMFALGILTLSTAGGGLAGYLMRIRQERNTQHRRLARERVRDDDADFDNTIEVVPALADNSQHSVS